MRAQIARTAVIAVLAGGGGLALGYASDGVRGALVLGAIAFVLPSLGGALAIAVRKSEREGAATALSADTILGVCLIVLGGFGVVTMMVALAVGSPDPTALGACLGLAIAGTAAARWALRRRAHRG
ncbi:MAG: hypothetical protein M3540_07425 [Actinomycetota bacterium]|nr:hypothetical protein [Actinomycetota bacterium]